MPEGGELVTAVDDCRVQAVKKYYCSSVLSCIIGKKIKEGCDRGSKNGKVYNEQDKEGPASLSKPEEIGQNRDLLERGVSSLQVSLNFVLTWACGQGTLSEGNAALALIS